MIAIKNLNGVKSGVYRVTTKNSIYIFDFDAMQVKRMSNSDEYIQETSDWSKFITVSCAVGSTMAVWTNNLDTDSSTFTYQYSTIVVSIEKVDRYE
jgi:hypothetical protein